MLRPYLISSLLASCGCFPSFVVTSATVGPAVPSAEPNCPVTFSTERTQDLFPTHEQVGVICFSAHDDAVIGRNRSDVERVILYRPGEAHDAVRREACSLGGELVAPIGICGRFDDLELSVWRRRRPQ